MSTDSLTEIEAAEQQLRERTQAEAAELAQRRQQALADAEAARQAAARSRLEVLDGDLIPGNEERAQQAQASLLDAVTNGDSVIVSALTTLLEAHHARHALHAEASSMESTLGLPATNRPQMQAAFDVVGHLVDTIASVADSRAHRPAALPAGKPRPTHAEQMELERQRHHGDQLLALYLDMGTADIAALTAEEYADKVTEAESEKQRRDAEVAQQAQANERDRRREPGFRSVLGS